MKEISGIQQIGIGIPNLKEAKFWYRDIMGMNAQVFEDAGTADLMLKYTGGIAGTRVAALTLNMQGGGGLEIWQYTSKVPDKPAHQPQFGDTGIYAAIFKCPNLEKARHHIQKNYHGEISDILPGPANSKSFWVLDPWGNRLKIMEDTHWFSFQNKPMGGILGAAIGVTDIHESLKLYQKILGAQEIIYDQSGLFHDIPDSLVARQEYRRVLLKRSEDSFGPFGRLLGPFCIELIQPLGRTPWKIFENRHWGDAGFIHLCFDVVDMEKISEQLNKSGFSFTVDSGKTFDMGDSAGRFTYIEDPDGTLLEFVETHKIPVLKKIGFYLNLTKRNRYKPLPNWMIRLLGLSKIK